MHGGTMVRQAELASSRVGAPLFSHLLVDESADEAGHQNSGHRGSRVCDSHQRACERTGPSDGAGPIYLG